MEWICWRLAPGALLLWSGPAKLLINYCGVMPARMAHLYGRTGGRPRNGKPGPGGARKPDAARAIVRRAAARRRGALAMGVQWPEPALRCAISLPVGDACANIRLRRCPSPARRGPNAVPPGLVGPGELARGPVAGAPGGSRCRQPEVPEGPIGPGCR